MTVAPVLGAILSPRCYMSEFDVFDVRKQIEAGIKIDLKLPDGKDSGFWIKVRNFRSDAYRNTIQAIQARIA